VDKVSRAKCDNGETGKRLEVQLQEHTSAVEAKTKPIFTIGHLNRAALTYHAIQENHVIN